MPNQFFGVNIPSPNEQLGKGGPLRISFSVDNPEQFKKFEESIPKFDEYYRQLYFNLVAEIHKYLLRLTPLHTGKLRGGWTAFLDKYRIDYSRQLFDTSLYNAFKKANKTPEYRTYQPDNMSVAAGKTLSKLEDKLPGDTDISVENQVDYKDFLEFGTSQIPGRHFTQQAVYKGEWLFDKYFEKWFKKMEDAGAIVEPPKVEEIDI